MFTHFSLQLSALPVEPTSPGLVSLINTETPLLCVRGER